MKIERKFEGQILKNKIVIMVFPLFLIYRLLYSMIPTIFHNLPGVQLVFLISMSLGYQMILISLKSQINKIEYYIDTISEFILLIMQMHMLIFIDGGIISGTPHNVS